MFRLGQWQKRKRWIMESELHTQPRNDLHFSPCFSTGVFSDVFVLRFVKVPTSIPIYGGICKLADLVRLKLFLTSISSFTQVQAQSV